MRKYLFVYALFLYSHLNATDLSKSLAHTQLKSALINEIVDITPAENHHFNLEAPQSCSQKKSKNNNSMNRSARLISCQFHESGAHEIRVSVCDNEKTFCKEEKINIEVKKKTSTQKSLAMESKPEPLGRQKEIRQLLQPGFKSLSPKQVLKDLTKKHKGVLLVFGTEWCPGCNENNEFLHPQEKFINLSSSFLKIYVDGDSSLKKDWLDYFDLKYYPSIVFFNPKLELITSFVGEPSTLEFSRAVDVFEQNKNDPIDKVKKRYLARKEASLLQKIKDFIGNKNNKIDTLRLLNWHYVSYNEKEYFDILKEQKNSDEISKVKKESLNLAKIFWLNEKLSSDDISATDKKKTSDEKKTLVTQYFAQSPSDTVGLYNYYSLMREYCELSEKEKSLGTVACQKAEENYKVSYLSLLEKEKKDLTEIDHSLKLAKFNKSLLSFSKWKGASSQDLMKVSSQCYESFEKLKKKTPLKENSRTVGLSQLKCLGSNKNKVSMSLIDKMIQKYPYDQMFYRRKAKALVEKKDYNLALSQVESAIKYSYGNLFYYNLLLKADILQKLKKTDQAKEILIEEIDKFSLKKGDKKKLKFLKKIRSKLASLI